MTDFASDYDALFDLTRREIEALRQHDPEHELLKFVGPVFETEHWETEIEQAFFTLFNPTGRLSWVKMLIAYLVAIRQALGRIPEEQPMTPGEPADTTPGEPVPF